MGPAMTGPDMTGPAMTITMTIIIMIPLMFLLCRIKASLN